MVESGRRLLGEGCEEIESDGDGSAFLAGLDTKRSASRRRRFSALRCLVNRLGLDLDQVRLLRPEVALACHSGV